MPTQISTRTKVIIAIGLCSSLEVSAETRVDEGCMVTWSVPCVWVSFGEFAVASVEEVVIVVIVVVVGRLDVSMPPVRQVVFADISENNEKRNHEFRWY